MRKTETSGTRRQTSKKRHTGQISVQQASHSEEKKRNKDPYPAGAPQEVDAIVEVRLGSAIAGSLEP